METIGLLPNAEAHLMQQ